MRKNIPEERQEGWTDGWKERRNGRMKEGREGERKEGRVGQIE